MIHIPAKCTRCFTKLVVCCKVSRSKSLSPPVHRLRCLCTESSVKRQLVLNTYHLGTPKISLRSCPLPIIPLCLCDLRFPQNRIPRLSSFKSPFVKIIRNACYENIFNGDIILTTYNTRSLQDTLGPQHGLLNYQLTTGLFRFVKQTLQLHHPRVEAFK